MFSKLLLGAVVAVTVTACSNEPARDDNGTVAQAPKTLKEVDPQAYHSSVKAAIDEVPRGMLPAFQKLFVCSVKLNNRSGHPRPIDAPYIRALTAALKANPAVANSCAA